MAGPAGRELDPAAHGKVGEPLCFLIPGSPMVGARPALLPQGGQPMEAPPAPVADMGAPVLDSLFVSG